MRRHAWTTAFLLSAVFITAGCATNPVTGKSQVVLISEPQEVEMGKQYYPLTNQMGEGVTPHRDIQALVQQVGQKMAKNSERPDLPWEFNVVDDNTPNAYALPGGKISITRGLISKMQNEDQLASVLGHEIGHVTARHQVVSASRDQLLGAALGLGSVAMQAGGVSGAGVIDMAAQIGAALLTTKYSRDQERQADELGMKYMTAGGYNPRAFVETMQILASAAQREPGQFETLFASHPLTSERVQTAERRLAEGYPEAQTRQPQVTAFARAIAPLKDEAPAFALADEARQLALKQQLPEAEQKLERAVRLVPQSPILNALWSDTLYDLRQFDRAENVSDRANTLNPSLFYGRLVNGAANFQLRNYQESMDQLRAAEKLLPGNLLVAFFAGRNFEETGNRQAAAEQYMKVAQATQGQGEYGQYAVARLSEWGYLRSN